MESFIYILKLHVGVRKYLIKLPQVSINFCIVRLCLERQYTGSFSSRSTYYEVERGLDNL